MITKRNVKFLSIKDQTTISPYFNVKVFIFEKEKAGPIGLLYKEHVVNLNKELKSNGELDNEYSALLNKMS
jgi:hypothetical protein